MNAIGLKHTPMVLRVVSQGSDTCAKIIAKTRLNCSTANRMLDALEAEGLITRMGRPRQRNRVIVLTEKGIRALEFLEGGHSEQ